MVEGLGRLLRDSELYRDQLTREEPVRIGLRLTDTGEEATLGFGEGLTLEPGLKAPAVTLTMDSGVFRGIMDGSRDFGAMIGRSRMSDVRPINYQLNDPGRLGDALETVKALMTVFFTPGRVKVRPLRRELAGDAHGAHPIPLVYWLGLRTAWYHVDRGETLNEEGERDPYPQCLVPLEGGGVLTLEQEELALEPGNAYYVPPGSVHKVRTEAGLTLLWLAWDTPP